MLHIYHANSKQKERFIPIKPGHVGLYVCGMTVYDHCHIGHARTMACFDTIVRHLTASHYCVNYVRNITDIDDKIIKRAFENNEPISALTERFIASLNHDAAALHIAPPSHTPRATEHIADMIAMIEQLIRLDFAYHAPDGDVYFSVAAYPAYGALSNQDLAKLRAGARVARDEDKRDSLDFVLWKMAKPGEPAWPSPWGDGRPGWHIECSAMAKSLLGEHFDLHGGGHDLLFPHHENEVAQSVCANQNAFVNNWLHVGFVQIDDEKMSKSLGNFFTIRDVLTTVSPEVLRYFLVSAHYRSAINYSKEALQQAEQALTRFYQALRHLPYVNASDVALADYEARYMAAMDDDFNTPEALAVLHDMAREINRLKDQQDPKAAVLGALLITLGQRLGILNESPEKFFQGGSADNMAHIEALVEERESARADKQWARADEIRTQLLKEGIVLEDTADGITWRKG